MSKWNQYNLFGAIAGGLTLTICLMYIKASPILLLPSAFSVGILYKCIKNMVKGVPVKVTKKSTTYTYNKTTNSTKKKKKKSR